MPNQLQPIIDQWYTHRDKGDAFRVVAVDAHSRTIETQNFDGDVEELDAEGWRAMDIERVEPPEDWTGPYDKIESDDRGYSETATNAVEWRESLESLKPAEERWRDSTPEEEGARVTPTVENQGEDNEGQPIRSLSK
jgi:hypothetical protein